MSEHALPHATRIGAVHPWTPFTDEELEQSIPQRFEQQALIHPDRLAIKSPEQSFTYDRLNRVANRLARTILSIRNRDAEAVALLLDHGADAPAAMLAVLKAGKFYLVLDPAYPPDRLSYMLADSGAGLVITDTKNLPLVAQLARGGLPAVNVDELDEGLAGDNLDVHPSPDALAMLLYTSGSTGNPKGVMHSHRNVLAEVRNLTNAWCVSSQDRWLAYTSFSFANSVRTVYCAFLNGGAVFPYDLKRNGFGALPDWLQSNRITILRTLPTTFRNFMASLPPNQVFRDVRVLSIGGEPMYRSDVDAFNEHFPPSCMIAHGMGPTECFMICQNFLPQGRRIEAGKLDIGWPLRDKEVHLLDAEGREVAAGEVGEICVKSRYVALGYWRDADRTKAAFTPDPHDPAIRTYRTGDLGVRAADGCLTHVGRRDFQVKVRGFRIDLSEIDVAMHAVDGVKDAVALAREDKEGEKRLVAYFVPSTTPAVTATHIRRSIARVLPEHMIPAAFICIDAMPLTPNGKTDRLRLPAPSRERPQLGSRFTPPSTPMEKALLSIWSEVLAIDDIGIHDDFFELGGDSLGAARVVGRVQRTFNVELPFTAIYEAPTPAELVKAIHESLPATSPATHEGLVTRVESRASRTADASDTATLMDASRMGVPGHSHRPWRIDTLARLLVAALVAALVAIACGAARGADIDSASAAAWPARTVRFIVSVSPGTSLDTLARIIAARLATALGQSVVVENRAGASGNIASEHVARSAPDGYTLLFTSNSIATLPALLGPRAVDPLTALAPVALVAAQPMVVVVHPSFTGSSFGDVVRVAKSAPGALPYATSGVGSLAHLTAVWAQARAGIAMLHVPYSGSQSFKDVLTGEVPLAFTFMGTALPLVRNGQLKAIAVTSRARSSVAPEIPSLHESGLPDFESMNWQGLLAPAGTPPEVIARLHAELVRIGADADVDARLRSMGYSPIYSTPAEFAEEIGQETRRWAAIVKAADLRIE